MTEKKALKNKNNGETTRWFTLRRAFSAIFAFVKRVTIDSVLAQNRLLYLSVHASLI